MNQGKTQICHFMSDEGKNLFFLLSGEHSTLPSSELESILKSEEYQYEILENIRQILRIKTEIESIKSITARAAMTRLCCLELFNCNAKTQEINQEIEIVPWRKLLKKGEDFAIRIKRIGVTTFRNDNFELQRRIGRKIMNRVKGIKVNLDTPKNVFLGILSENKFVFGLKLSEIPRKPFVDRRPSNRPFFYPAAMQAKLARCMINLSQPKKGDSVLDPFCGAGSILIEAGLIGCKMLGTDIKRKMVRGSLENLLHQNLRPDGLIVADALRLPFDKVDCLVTDPPYGRSSTTLGRSIEKLLRDFLSVIKDGSIKINRICMSAPRCLKLGKIIRGLGFTLEDSHFVYVHKSLTREIVVFR